MQAGIHLPVKLFLILLQIVKQLQEQEKRWVETEDKMINKLEILRDKMYNVPKEGATNIIISLILAPLKEAMEKLRIIID